MGDGWFKVAGMARAVEIVKSGTGNLKSKKSIQRMVEI